MTHTLTVRPEQARELLARYRAQEAAQQSFASALALLAVGAVPLDAQLRGIDDATGVLTFEAPDAAPSGPELVPDARD